MRANRKSVSTLADGSIVIFGGSRRTTFASIGGCARDNDIGKDLLVLLKMKAEHLHAWESERRGVQSSGKTYIPAYRFARPSDLGVCAGWEAGFRLTGNRKPATDGVSGLFWRLLPSLTRPTAIARVGDSPTHRSDPVTLGGTDGHAPLLLRHLR